MKNNLNTEYIAPCNTDCSFCFLNYTNELSKNYLFRNISPAEVGKVIRKIHHQVKEYKKGKVIAYAGDEYNRLLIVLTGTVVGEIIDFEGKALRIEELKAPNTIASAFLFGDENNLPVNITAQEDTRLLTIERADLLALFRTYDTILHNYLDIISNRAQHLSRKIKMLGLQTIRGKLAHYLLEHTVSEGSNEIRLTSSQEVLASNFGITRPSLARVIREMHNAGYISARGKMIKIINRAALSKLLK